MRSWEKMTAPQGFYYPALFSILLVLLNDWGKPFFTGSIPYVSVQFFMNGLRVYAACCLCWFCIRRFIISFFPCVLFSFALFANISLNVITAFTEIIYSLSFLITAIYACINNRKQDLSTVSGLFTGSSSIFIFSVFSSFLLIPCIIMDSISLLFFTAGIITDTERRDQLTRLYAIHDQNRQYEPGNVFTTLGLSLREQEVSILLLQRKTNHQIAEILFISTATVKTHIQNIFAKTNTHNRMEFSYLLTVSDKSALNRSVKNTRHAQNQPFSR